jgi:hypothetical protein
VYGCLKFEQIARGMVLLRVRLVIAVGHIVVAFSSFYIFYVSKAESWGGGTCDML